MRSAVALVSLLYLAGQYGAHSGLLNAGLYDLKLLREESCEDVGTGEFNMDLRLSKTSTRKTFLRGNVVHPYDLDDNVHGEMNYSRFGSRGWGMNAYHTTSKNFCKTWQKNSPYLFRMFYGAWGIENPTCPIKARGRYLSGNEIMYITGWDDSAPTVSAPRYTNGNLRPTFL